MKIIAIVSQKGGAGKTTLALHIAVAAERAGLSAAILDMDPQGTAERWSEWRKEEPPAVVAAKATTLARRIEQARGADGDLVVIDTPPLAQTEAREAARIADLILIPCRPSAFDLDAIRITADLANDIRKPAFVVVNAGPPHGTSVYRDVAETVEALRPEGRAGPAGGAGCLPACRSRGQIRARDGAGRQGGRGGRRALDLDCGTARHQDGT